MASMISDLLKTPQQLREEQLNKLRALGQTNAQNALLAGKGGSAISGAIAGLAAQGQSILPETMEGAKRGGLLGIGNIAQALGAEGLGQSLQTAAVPAAERAAAAQQQAIKGSDTKTVEGLRATAQKLREAGNAAAALKIEEMANKKEIEEGKLQVEQAKVTLEQGEFILKQNEAKDKKERNSLFTALKMPTTVASNFDPVSLSDASSVYSQTGDIDLARKMLKTVEKKPLVQIGDSANKANVQQFLGEEVPMLAKKAEIAAPIERDSAYLLKNLDKIYTGTLGEATLSVKKAFQALGMSSKEADRAISDSEFLQKFTLETALAFVEKTSGSISNAEMELFIKAAPGLSKSREGNRLLLKLVNEAAKRDKKIVLHAAKWQTQNPTKGFTDWLIEKQRYRDEELGAWVTTEQIEEFTGGGSDSKPTSTTTTGTKGKTTPSLEGFTPADIQYLKDQGRL